MIVDDHSIVRVGLRQVLEQTGEFEVVGEAADGEEAVRVAAEVSPEVVVMDVMMPKKDGVEACREIMESAPEIRVVMLTASTEEEAVVEAVAAGATGYLQKETGRDRLLSTVRDVAMGELRVPAEVVTRVFAAIRGTARRRDMPSDARRADSERAGDTHLLRQGHVLLPDSGGQGHQARHRPERHLRHPAEAECRIDAGTGALGRAERIAGRLCHGRLAADPCTLRPTFPA